MILHFFIIFITLILPIKSQTNQCYAEIESHYPYIADRTPYVVSRGSEMNSPKDCEAIHVWSLIRHGTRYPETTFIKSIDKLYILRDEIIKNHKNGRGLLCEKELQNLAQWKSNFSADSVHEYDLAPQGIQDQIFLARIMKEKFPKLLKSSTKEHLTTSDTNRTRNSAIAFTNELLGTTFETTEGNNITEDGAFLQPIEHCPKFSESLKRALAETEVILFKKGAYFQKIIAEISIRLGYLQTLPFESIYLMVNACSYENAWYVGSRSPFCAAFSFSDLEMWNYYYELVVYYWAGYGNSHSYQLGCPIVQDMLKSLKQAAENNLQSRKGRFLFSHSETICSTTVRLGFFKDNDTLRHDNYQKMINQRLWRLSQFDTFAANIVAVLYRCSSQNGNQTKVSIYQNEWSVKFPECGNSDLCDLETLLRKYSNVFDENNCNLNFCALSENFEKAHGHSWGSKLSQWSGNILVVVPSIIIYNIIVSHL